MFMDVLDTHIRNTLNCASHVLGSYRIDYKRPQLQQYDYAHAKTYVTKFVHADSVKLMEHALFKHMKYSVVIKNSNSHWKYRDDCRKLWYENISQWQVLLLHGPLASYVKLWVTHAPGMPGIFSPPPRVSDPDTHHGTCVTHVPWCMPGSLLNGFL